MHRERLTDRCRGRWSEIITALAPHPEMLNAIARGPKRHGWCPVHRGKHGDAFRIAKEFEDTGKVWCNTCGSRLGFGLLMWLNNWDQVTTGRAIAAYLDGGAAHPVSVAHEARKQPSAAAKSKGYAVEQLEAIWEQAAPPDDVHGEPLRKYLAGRGLVDLSRMSQVRCHPELDYYEAGDSGYRLVGRYPTMLARLVDINGELVALHRTYLTPDGDKAPVSSVKKLLTARDRTASGSAVRLSEPSSILGVAEGLETSYSVMLATGMPVWSATSAPLLGSLVLPPQVHRVVIWADLDELVHLADSRVREPGREAAEKLAARLRADYRSVDILYPKLELRGIDWNDVWRKTGSEGFPTLSNRFGFLPTAYRLAMRLCNRSH